MKLACRLIDWSEPMWHIWYCQQPARIRTRKVDCKVDLFIGYDARQIIYYRKMGKYPHVLVFMDLNKSMADCRRSSSGGAIRKNNLCGKEVLHKTIVRPAMIYGSECWAAKKNDTQKLHTTEMRMLRWARGNTKKDHIKNEDIWREANVEPMTTFLKKKRLPWCGHVLRKEWEDTTKKKLNMQVQGKRRRGGPRKDGWTISGGHEREQDDGIHGTQLKCVAR